MSGDEAKTEGDKQSRAAKRVGKYRGWMGCIHEVECAQLRRKDSSTKHISLHWRNWCTCFQGQVRQNTPSYAPYR